MHAIRDATLQNMLFLEFFVLFPAKIYQINIIFINIPAK